jgi:hypothetical protein
MMARWWKRTVALGVLIALACWQPGWAFLAVLLPGVGIVKLVSVVIPGASISSETPVPIRQVPVLGERVGAIGLVPLVALAFWVVVALMFWLRHRRISRN